MTVGHLVGGPYDGATVDLPYIGKDLCGPFFDRHPEGKYVLVGPYNDSVDLHLEYRWTVVSDAKVTHQPRNPAR